MSDITAGERVISETLHDGMMKVAIFAAAIICERAGRDDLAHEIRFMVSKYAPETETTTYAQAAAPWFEWENSVNRPPMFGADIGVSDFEPLFPKWAVEIFAPAVVERPDQGTQTPMNTK